MESGGVSLPLIHKHLMMPWNFLGKGDCCGRFEAITDGYFCKICRFFVHKKCSESSEFIQHPSHSIHTLQLRNKGRYDNCNLCGSSYIWNLSYCCEICDFDMCLYCNKYPPPEFIEVSETHPHKLTLLKKCEITLSEKFDCYKCGKTGAYEFHYECHECDLAFHVDCAWHPPEIKYPLEYTTMDIGERVLLPWIHTHFMMPWNCLSKGDCCGRYKTITDGYYCKVCDFFVHKECGEVTESIKHPSHPIHLLWLRSAPHDNNCNLCGRSIVDLFYRCNICNFNVDLYCAKYPPPEVIDISETHHHKLTLLKKQIECDTLLKKQTGFDCDAKCGKSSNGFPYKCHECDLFFHVDCVWHPLDVKHSLEVNHSYHPLHPLKLVMSRLLDYSDGKCRLCGRNIDDRLFYHCSSSNFTLDMRCVLKPPPQFLLDLKAHDHQLTLLPRLDSFTCNACGLKGDRSPYVCFQCGFMIHQDCLNLPRVININRHDHRISRTSVLGVVNSVCGVCREKVDWTFGGYSCQRCLGYVVHSKCATKKNVWNGKELEGVPEEIEDIEPYTVIDDNRIQHFSHKEHYLRLNGNGLLWEEKKRCNACTHPIDLQSFYGCVDCEFILHRNCAELPRKKWHVLHNERLTLVPCNNGDFFICAACNRYSNGFMYQHGEMKIDVRCSSIVEPFVHPSHPHHPLYYIPRDDFEFCYACNDCEEHVLRCIEDGCEFVLGFRCATLPQVVKHRVDDHSLSLCYGEQDASGKYWCDICEKKTNPKTWFYTCKDQRASLHTECVLGDCVRLMPRSTIEYHRRLYEAVLNSSVTRPFCKKCESHCMYPIFLKMVETSDTYVCSFNCALYFI